MKSDLLKTDSLCDITQGAFSQLVSLGIAIDKKYRAAQHSAVKPLACCELGAALKLADELLQQTPERQRLPHQFSVFVHQRRAQ